MKKPSPKTLGRTEALLFEREAQVLGWSLLARMVFLSIGSGLVALHIAGILPAGVISQSAADAWPSLGVFGTSGVLAAGLYWTIRNHDRYVHVVGEGAVLIDLVVLASLPWIWLHAVPQLSTYPAGLVKGDLFAIALLLIVINSISLCPQYPALMAAGSIAVLSTVAALTLDDPGVTFTISYVEHFRTESVNTGILFIRIIILALCGGFLSALAFTARRTIREAVKLEIDNLELRERQAEMAFEGRMAALDGMVSGIAHEINTPLGAVRSSVNTTASAAQKLVSTPQEAPPRTQRILQIVSDVTRSALLGLDRIGGLVESLKGFSRLDEAEVQQADLRAELDTVLSLIEPAAIGNIKIEKNYGEIPEIQCRPRELNQAFMTILVNAFDAMKGEGRLALSIAQVNSDIRVTIADSGPGIAPELREDLFDLNFSQTGKRIGMGLGLPTSRRIVERHGGTVTIDPATTSGASFTISLPVKPSS